MDYRSKWYWKSSREKFADNGWLVAVSARREKILKEMSLHDNIYSFPLDVTKEEEVKKTFNLIIEKFKDLDLTYFRAVPMTQNLKDKHQQNKFVMETNYFGVLHCLKAVEKYFKDKKNGHISIVSSIIHTEVYLIQVVTAPQAAL